MTDIGTLGGSNSAGAAINASANIAGTSDVAGNTTSHAFLFTRPVMLDLGTLPTYPESHALGLNADDEVVGTAELIQNHQVISSRAFVFRNGSMTDLNTGISANSGWVLTSASAINDHGQIVGAEFSRVIRGGLPAYAIQYGAFLPRRRPAWITGVSAAQHSGGRLGIECDSAAGFHQCSCRNTRV